MSRFFFNIFNDQITIDEEGVELPDAEAAHQFAVTSVRQLVAERALEGSLHRHHRVEVQDAGRNVLFEVRFDEAVKMLP